VSHPLANREFLFPFASIVDMSSQDLACVPDCFGQTLSATVLTSDKDFIRRLLQSAAIGRLNLGAIPTNAIAWEQPHEGNLFDHLYGRRAFQAKGDLAAASA